jgi:hypothetical protein
MIESCGVTPACRKWSAYFQKGHPQPALFRLRAITDGSKTPAKINFTSLFVSILKATRGYEDEEFQPCGGAD